MYVTEQDINALGSLKLDNEGGEIVLRRMLYGGSAEIINF